MEVKKSDKANLENYRTIFFLFGLVIVLIGVYLVMNISKSNVKIQDLKGNMNSNVEEEQVAVTRQDVTPPPPPPPQKQVSDVIEIVKNDVKIQDQFDIDMDVDEESSVDFSDMDLEDNTQEEEPEPVIWAEQMPEFPGGEIALRKYIADHIEYPELAAENGIQGTVYLRFVVDRSGKVGKVQIIKGVDDLLDKEAVRVVKTLPRFKPGMQGGKPVPVWFSVPIVFVLNN